MNGEREMMVDRGVGCGAVARQESSSPPGAHFVSGGGSMVVYFEGGRFVSFSFVREVGRSMWWEEERKEEEEQGVDWDFACRSIISAHCLFFYSPCPSLSTRSNLIFCLLPLPLPLVM